jgi:quinoprotein dehydrogenase-associated probable ABC transporter substrate-binding protein
MQPHLPSSAWPRLALAAALLPAGAASAQAPAPPAAVLRVCADPGNLPLSNDRGEGYENKIAEALARDLKRRLEYTYFPQRMGFVRNTLRARDEQTHEFRCDVIIGVPRGYELTATTRPYLHSTYALLVPSSAELAGVTSVAELLALPAARRDTLRIGVFARTPAADWILQHGFVAHAVFYPPQSGDPQETAESIVERDLSSGAIDAAILWGPIAAYLAARHPADSSHGKGWNALAFPVEPGIRFDYEMTMGVRFGEDAWREELDAWIGAHQAEIDAILASYHVPRVEAPSPGR